MKHEIKIVNHQIQDYAHLGSTWLVWCEAARFNEKRGLDQSFDLPDGSIIPLYMTYLEYQFPLSSQADQLLCLLDGLGDRFFQEQMNAFLEEISASSGSSLLQIEDT